MIERTWDEVVATLRDRDAVPAAQAAAALLEAVRDGWEGRVLPDLWMHDLRFVASGDLGRGVAEVRAGWADGVFSIVFMDERGLVVSGDKCRSITAPAVLTAFLEQLPLAQ